MADDSHGPKHLARHGVFDEPDLAELIAGRLRDPKAIAKARVFRYQLMVAYTSSDSTTILSRVDWR